MSNFKKVLLDPVKSETDIYFEEQADFLLQKQKLDRIDNFNGYFDFLNNEYSCPVFYKGLLYKSISHGYQAARSDKQHIREKIALADTAIELYDIASKIEDPENWIKVRLLVMEILLRDKFRRNKDLRERLKATANRDLINAYADLTLSNIFWGVVDNKGQNNLGRLLEEIRDDCNKNLELEKWTFMCFKLQDDKNFIPITKLTVFNFFYEKKINFKI